MRPARLPLIFSYRPIAMRSFQQRITPADRGKEGVFHYFPPTDKGENCLTTRFSPMKEKNYLFALLPFSDSRRVWDVAKSDVPLCAENQRKYQYCCFPFLIFGTPRYPTFHGTALSVENKRKESSPVKRGKIL